MLQSSRLVVDHLRQLLAEGDVPSDAFRAPATKAISLAVEDLYPADQAVRVRVGCEDPQAFLTVAVTDAQSGRQVARIALDGTGDALRPVDCGALPEGTYRVRASGVDGGSASDVFVVMRS